MFGGVGMWEIILVFMVVLLLFGAKRLPEIGSSLGKGIREFKGSIREIEGELTLPEDNKPVRPKSSASSSNTESSTSEDPEDESNGEPRRLTTSR